MADNDQWLHDADRLDIPGPRKVKRPRVQLDSEKFGQFAEATARFMGTAKFLVYMTVIVCSWVIWNLVAIYKLRFDPYPFILLNLAFSTQAAYAAPLILLAQNRQENRDRVALEEDRRRAEQTKADTEFLARELAALRLAVGEVATRDYLRRELDEIRDLLEALQAQSAGRSKQDAGERKPKKSG